MIIWILILKDWRNNIVSEILETITISKKAYDEMQKDVNKLRALESGGVDNWEWYDLSIENYETETGLKVR